MKEAAFPSCAPTTAFLLNFSLSNLAAASVSFTSLQPTDSLIPSFPPSNSPQL